MDGRLERAGSEIEEKKLWNNGREREVWDNLGDLYAIFKATEALEKANTRDVVPAGEYVPHCERLIKNFQNVQRLVENGGSGDSVASFVKKYNIEKECPLAKHRLLDDPHPVSNVPAAGSDGLAAAADAVHRFMYVLDQLRMGLVAVDQIVGPMNDLYESLRKINRPGAEDGTEKARTWLAKLKQMKASDELGGEDLRQILMDMETAYADFHKSLSL